MAATYDAVIVGGGIAGLSLASALAGRCSVALVEAEHQLAYHTSSRSARQLMIRSTTTVAMNSRAYTMW